MPTSTIVLKAHASEAEDIDATPELALVERSDAYYLASRAEHIQQVMAQEGLTEARFGCDVAWLGGDGNEQFREMVVGKSSFWFIATIKHSDCEVVSEMMTPDQLRSLAGVDSRENVAILSPDAWMIVEGSLWLGDSLENEGLEMIQADID